MPSNATKAFFETMKSTLDTDGNGRVSLREATASSGLAAVEALVRGTQDAVEEANSPEAIAARRAKRAARRASRNSNPDNE